MPGHNARRGGIGGSPAHRCKSRGSGWARRSGRSSRGHAGDDTCAVGAKRNGMGILDSVRPESDRQAWLCDAREPESLRGPPKPSMLLAVTLGTRMRFEMFTPIQTGTGLYRKGCEENCSVVNKKWVVLSGRRIPLELS